MLDKDEKLWLVALGNIKFITIAREREGAKRNAHYWIGGNSDSYVCSPLTNSGDRIHLDLTLFI